MRISDWSSDVCSSDLQVGIARAEPYEPCIDGKEQRTDAVSAQRLWQAAEQVDEEESPEREDDDVGQNHHADGDRVPAHFAPGGAPEAVVDRELRQDGEQHDAQSSRARLDGHPQHENCIEDASDRSEEHTSELQSLMRISYAVFCLQK